MSLELTITWDENGLVPAIIQDDATQQVLMLGYLNKESLSLTLASKRVTFWSRSRNELWEKGATSGNFLNVVSIENDCDKDALLIKVIPEGPTCHTGTISCFSEVENSNFSVLDKLISVIDDRFSSPKEASYIQSLIKKGLPKIAQKVGEEGVELVIEAMRDEPELFNEEAADLLFHYLILLRAKEVPFSAILKVLKEREK